MTIRPATQNDAPAIAAIYRPIVERTAISFETEAPTNDEMAARIINAQTSWAYLVAEQDNAVVGYAYGGAHRPRAAYRFSVEVSAYVAEPYRQRGIAADLYHALLPALRDKGHANAYAGIALPNPASIALHERLGFSAIGVFPRVGYKFEQWHDVGWYHRALDEGDTP